jgi:hypothetical protein
VTGEHHGKGVDYRRKYGPGLGGLALLALGMHFVVGTPFFAVFLCGMFATWALRGAWWAWIPAALFGIDALDHSGVNLGGVGLPVLFIAAGVLVVAHDHIWPPARKIGLIVIGCLILAGLFNSDRDHPVLDRMRDKRGAISSSSSVRSEVSPPTAAELEGKTVIITNGSGDVRLTSSSPSAEGSRTPVRWQLAGPSVIVTAADGSKDIELQLPEAVGSIVVKTGSGDVKAEGLWPALTVTTGSGDVDLRLEGNPTVDVTTGDGTIDLEGYEQKHPEHHFRSDGPDGIVTIVTGEGDVDIARKDKVLR